MNKILIKNIVMILIIISTMLILTTVSNAASLSISTSKSSVEPGEVFTATITLSGGAGPISASVQNGSGSGTQFLDNGSMSISCTAGSSGTVTISASGTVGDYATEQDVNVSNSKSVTIVVPEAPAPTTPSTPTTQTPTKTNPSVPSKTTTPTRPTVDTYTKSSNANLSNLEIAEGAITPEFDSGITEYSISVPNEITKLSIAAITDNSKAIVTIEGNEELQVGENTIDVVVTAEDGSTKTYKILATRALAELNLQSLNIYYINENGEKVLLKLTPEFASNIYKYTISKELPYTVESLKVDTTSSRENAEIEIIGNEKLETGENVITIKLIAHNEVKSIEDETNDESEELNEIAVNETIEEKSYTITVTKEAEPVVVPVTTIGKIKNFFTGFTAKFGSWATKNFDRIISGMLLIATAAFAGLTIYFVADYKNYKNLLAKLAEFNKEELMEKANVALNVEKAPVTENIEEEVKTNKIKEEKVTSKKIDEFIEEARKEKAVKGRRFK